MKNAFVLMTAMPPTTGHWQLIQFASQLAKRVTVMVCTQPHEPFPNERAAALRQAIQNHGLERIRLIHYDKTTEQDPAAPGFWEKWKAAIVQCGLKKGDYIVSSEPYGQRLAEVTGAQFFPYDIDRDINPAKATPVREDPLAHFADIIPEFQPYLRTTVTVFGAESTGKTTLSRQLAQKLHGYFLFEYARPYLENTVNEITVRSMTAIWEGQAALQKHAAKNLAGKPFVIQDTDLFSTVGYWQFPHWKQHIGACPDQLIADAKALRSDIYLITQSNIPFEEDPLRYGGNVREGSDEYWIHICKANQLPYAVLQSADSAERLREAAAIVRNVAAQKVSRLAYDRHGL